MAGCQAWSGRHAWATTSSAKPFGAYHLVASAKLLAAVDPGMTKLHLIPLDPENILPMADPDPLPVRPMTPPKTTPKKRPRNYGWPPPVGSAPARGSKPVAASR